MTSRKVTGAFASVASRDVTFWAGVGTVLLAALLYFLTLDNGLRLDELMGGDLITHQYAQAQLRLTNAPGYPIYTVLGWLWFQLGRAFLTSMLNPIQILSLFSTWWALAALAVLYLLILRLTSGNWPIASLATLTYAASYFFWYYSVTTEEYTLGILQTLLLVYLAVRWDENHDDRYLLLLAFVAGTAAANLVTVLFAFPALAAFILFKRPQLLRRAKLLGAGLLVAFLPLLSYAYVLIRAVQHPEWRGEGEWTSLWTWFLAFLSTQQGRDELTWTLGGIPWNMVETALRELTPVGLVLGLIGIGFLGRRRAGLLFGIVAVYVLFAYVDRFGNWFQVFMPVYAILTLGIAFLADRAWRRWPGWPRAVVAGGLLAILVAQLWTNYPLADQADRADDNGLDLGWGIVESRPAPGACVAGSYEENLSIDYLVGIWQSRPDIRVAAPDAVAQELAQGTAPLYFTLAVAPQVLPQLDRFHLSSQGGRLIELRQDPNRTPPQPGHARDDVLPRGMHLLGYDLETRQIAEAGQTSHRLELTLYWKADRIMDLDYALSVRPTSGGDFLFVGDQLIHQDRQHPVHGLYPTSAWKEGEIVADTHVITFPPLPFDGVTVIVYSTSEEGFENAGILPLPVDQAPVKDL
jgi:hypothetical protein